MNDEKYLEFSLISERYAMDKCGSCGASDYNLTRNKKFAELIVRECLTILDPENDLTSMREEYGRRLSMNIIKTHFGIKEKLNED